MMNTLVPRYLLGKYQLIATVTFTALFSMAFLLVSIPFSNNAWFKLGASQAFLFTVIFCLLALFVIIFSKRMMYKLRNRIKMTYVRYVLWDVAEVIIISAMYTGLTMDAHGMGIIDIGDRTASNIFFKSLIYSFTSLLVPYIIAGMYFAIIDKNNTIRLMNFSNVVSDVVVAPDDEKKITLFDNNGVLKLAVSARNLYYIESDDNYIKVWYSDAKGELKTYMIRSKLKTVEESFLGSSLIRCHRKYIVNLDKVTVLRKEKDGYELALDNESIQPIPITKTYLDTVLSKFDFKSVKKES